MRNKILGGFAVLVVAAIAAFNVNLTSEDEFSLLSLANVEALANGEGPNDPVWIRTDGDCTYEFQTKAYGDVQLNLTGIGIVKLKANAHGEAKYTAYNAKTHCELGGKEQCTARYCPVAFWN